MYKNKQGYIILYFQLFTKYGGKKKNVFYSSPHGALKYTHCKVWEFSRGVMWHISSSNTQSLRVFPELISKQTLQRKDCALSFPHKTHRTLRRYLKSLTPQQMQWGRKLNYQNFISASDAHQGVSCIWLNQLPAKQNVSDTVCPTLNSQEGELWIFCEALLIKSLNIFVIAFLQSASIYPNVNVA